MARPVIKAPPPRQPKGALAVDPAPWKAGTTREKLLEQQTRIQGRIDGGKALDPNEAARRLQVVNSALAKMPPAVGENPVTGTDPGVVDPGASSPGDVTGGDIIPNNTWDDGLSGLFGMGNDAISGLINEIQNTGPFNPGDYSAQRQRAEDAVMKSFERSNQARWGREEENFRARMNQQGIPEGSDAYRQRYAIEVGEPKQQAYEQAQNQAVQSGQQEQAQAFGQAYQQYKAPGDMLGSFDPYLGAQSNLTGIGLQGLTQEKLDAANNAARQDLQRLVDSGQMSLQEARQKWQQRQNRYDRVLERKKIDAQKEMSAAQNATQIGIANTNRDAAFDQMLAAQGLSQAQINAIKNAVPGAGSSFGAGVQQGATSTIGAALI